MISMRLPGPASVRREPAAFVNRSASTPSAANVRIGSLMTAGGWPS